MIVLNQYDEVLVGRRKSRSGNGKYQFPGGWLEYCETFAACAVGELEEEAGIVAKEEDVKLVHMLNVYDKKQRYHTVDLYMLYQVKKEEVNPVNMEPESSHGWEWMKWDTFTNLARELHFLPNLVFFDCGFSDLNKIKAFT